MDLQSLVKGLNVEKTIHKTNGEKLKVRGRILTDPIYHENVKQYSVLVLQEDGAFSNEYVEDLIVTFETLLGIFTEENPIES